MATRRVNIDQFGAEVTRALTMLTAELPAIGLVNAQTARAVIQQRIQTTGLKADGSLLGKYSDTKLPAKWFIGKTTNAAAASFVQAAADNGEKISYKDIRAAQGFQTEFVDLTFTSRMWNNIGIKQESLSGDRITLTIGASTTEDEAKLVNNSIRFGDVLDLSVQETVDIGADITADIIDFFNKVLND